MMDTHEKICLKPQVYLSCIFMKRLNYHISELVFQLIQLPSSQFNKAFELSFLEVIHKSFVSFFLQLGGICEHCKLLHWEFQAKSPKDFGRNVIQM